MITLARYLSGRLALATLGTVLVLGALVQIVDLLDVGEDIMAIGEGLRGLAFYVAMRTPSIVPEVLPLAVLLAALAVLAPMVRSGEFVAMRAAGFRAAQIALAFLPAVAGIALAHYAVSDALRPPAERRLAEWWADNGVKAGRPVWIRVENALIEIGRVRDGGRRLENVRIFRRDAGNAVDARTVAGAARFADSGWTLDDATTTDLTRRAIGEGRPADGAWETSLLPRDVVEAMAPNANVSAGVAYDVLVGRRLAVAPPAVYAVALQRAFAEPAGNLVMLLIALPVAFASARLGAGGRLLAPLGFGLLFLLADGVVATLGRSGLLSPLVSAWTPALVFALLAALALGQLERGRRFLWIAPS